MAKELTDNSFSKDVLESNGVTLVDFWAPWCGPCRQLTPIVEELSKEMEGKVNVYKCNIDENPETPSQYAVRGIPTLMIFKDGKLVDTKVGALSKSALHEWVNNNL
jgi:thioredoxin 1